MKKATSNSIELDERLLRAAADSAVAAVIEAGPGAERLIDQWLTLGNTAAIAQVAETGAGSARKAARRALNVLKSRGVAVPRQRRVATLLVGKSAEQFDAWMVPPDAVGNLLLVVAARTRETRFRAALAFLNDTLGIQRVETAEMSQSGLKETLARVLPSSALKPVRVPVSWARWRFEAARQKHAARGVPLPLGLESAGALFAPAPDEAPSHPFDEEGLELVDDDAAELAKGSITLHSLPEFRAWLPPKAAVDHMLRDVGEGLKPGEQPDAEVLKGHLDRAIASATDRFFSPERRADLVRAMRDCGLSVLSREGEQRALELAAAMQVIERAGLITDPPHEVGFLRGFFEKAVSVLIAQGGGNLRIPVPASAAAPADMAETAETVETPETAGAPETAEAQKAPETPDSPPTPSGSE